MSLELSERQRATVASALTLVSAVIIICALAGVLLLVAQFFRRFSNVLLPLAVAGVLALVLKPVHTFCITRLRLSPKLAVVAVFLVILLPIGGLGWFFGDLLVSQASELVSRLPALWSWIQEQVSTRWPEVIRYWESKNLTEKIQEAIEGRENELVTGLQFLGGKGIDVLLGTFGFIGGLLNWVLLPIYLAFFLLVESEGPTSWADTALPFLKSDTRRDIAYLVDEFVNILVAFFRGQLLIALLQGLLFAIGFSVVGLRYGAVIGLTLGFLNIVPYLGSIIGLGIAIPLAFFQGGGGIWTVLGVAIVFTVVQMIEGYLLTPKIMGDQTGLHPIVIMVAIFFWGSALHGIAGMILAIPLTAFFVVFWRLAREKYIRELV